MHLLELIKSLDTSLFLFLNGLHTSFFDGFMYAFSAKLTWIPLYASVLYIIIRHWKKDAVWIALALILCIVISDQVSSGLIKHLVHRLRPSQTDDLKALVHIVNDYRGGLYGFVSSHAANAVGFALLSSMLFKQRFYTVAVFSWAVLISYSRIYLGVHYPLDIVGGAIVGVVAALICYWAICKYRPDLKPAGSDVQIQVPVFVFGLSLLGIIIYSFVA